MMTTSQMPTGHSDYARVERAVHFIRAHAHQQPSLAQVAQAVGLSEFHFQRLFLRWAGVSPKRFLQFLTLERAKALLRERRSVLESSLEVGLSGPGRLHDLFLNVERMTPGQYRAGAAGIRIAWGWAPTPLGNALFATVGEALCALSFVRPGHEASAVRLLRERWPGAVLEERPSAIKAHAKAVCARLTGEPAHPLSVLLKGTPLQLKVWEALLRIPEGAVATYGDVGRMVGLPTAARAVGTAIGANPIGYLIPCHRVIRSTGVFGDYRWGPDRKAALLGLEQARTLSCESDPAGLRFGA